MVCSYTYELLYVAHLHSTPSIKKKQTMGFRVQLWLSVLYEIFL